MGLILSQHSQSAASFEAQSSDCPHHFQNAIELWTHRHVTPCRTHAKAGNTIVPSARRRRDCLLQAQQRLPADPRAVVPGLRTVVAVFWTATRLYTQESAPLHLLSRMIEPVRLLRLEDQIGNRLQIYRLNLFYRPVVPELRNSHRHLLKGSRIIRGPPPRDRTAVRQHQVGVLFPFFDRTPSD